MIYRKGNNAARQGSNLVEPHDGGSHNFFSICTGTRVFDIIQSICVCWFSVELLFRFCVCANFIKFIKSPQNIIDFLSTFPFYVEIVLWSINFNMRQFSTARTALLLLRFMRIAKVFTVLKLARYFPELRVLGETLKSASRELLMLVMFVLINLLIFSSIVYHLEKDEIGTSFDSIPASFWWGIATLTTVGYGDITPQSVGGKLVGSVGCVTGVMIMALPVSILVDRFTEAYRRLTKKPVVTNKSHTNGVVANGNVCNGGNKIEAKNKFRLNVIKNVLYRKQKLAAFKLKNRINVSFVFCQCMLSF